MNPCLILTGASHSRCPVISATTCPGQNARPSTVCPGRAPSTMAFSSLLIKTTSHSDQTGLWTPSSLLLWPSMVRPWVHAQGWVSVWRAGPRGGQIAGGGPGSESLQGVETQACDWFGLMREEAKVSYDGGVEHVQHEEPWAKGTPQCPPPHSPLPWQLNHLPSHCLLALEACLPEYPLL